LSLSCTHPPFQINGNSGGTSDMNEIIPYSEVDVIIRLPKFPDTLPAGEDKFFKTHRRLEMKSSVKKKK